MPTGICLSSISSATSSYPSNLRTPFSRVDAVSPVRWSRWPGRRARSDVRIGPGKCGHGSLHRGCLVPSTGHSWCASTELAATSAPITPGESFWSVLIAPLLTSGTVRPESAADLPRRGMPSALTRDLTPRSTAHRIDTRRSDRTLEDALIDFTRRFQNQFRVASSPLNSATPIAAGAAFVVERRGRVGSR
jgi:hypothetical protein